MAVKTAAALKASFVSADPNDYAVDLIDTIGDPAILPAASATAAGKVELATDAEAKTGTDTARAVTAANVRAVLTGLKFISLDGSNGAGACTATGAVVGDKVLYVSGLTPGALGNASASFEATVTVNDQVQQAAYRVKAGRFGARKQYGVGDLVELDPAHAVGFEDKLELVVEAEAKAEAEEPKPVKAKAKA